MTNTPDEVLAPAQTLASNQTLAPNQTPGLVCAHHHLYSALARGMPAPPRTPTRFIEILELVWWRLDRALDEDMIYWSAKLGALEALQRGCTAIIDHHESPNAIEGSLSIIADACAEVGVRVNCSYGVTDRHGADGARRGLAENDRFLKDGGRGMVGLHAAFTCSDETIAAAADLSIRHNVGVHVHVAEGREDSWSRLVEYTNTNWWLVHGVYLPDDHGLLGTIVHNPRSNMNNSVDYAEPRRFTNPIGLGTDGIGADMLDEFRLAFVAARASDVTADPDLVWQWLEPGWQLMPEGPIRPRYLGLFANGSLAFGVLAGCVADNGRSRRCGCVAVRWTNARRWRRSARQGCRISTEAVQRTRRPSLILNSLSIHSQSRVTHSDTEPQNPR